MGLLPEPIQGQSPSPSTVGPAVGVPVDSTNATSVLSYTGPETAAYDVSVAAHMEKDAVVSIWAAYTDQDGTPQTYYWTDETGWQLSAGDDYGFLNVTLAVLGGHALSVYVQASVAGAVKFSGAIELLV